MGTVTGPETTYAPPATPPRAPGPPSAAPPAAPPIAETLGVGQRTKRRRLRPWMLLAALAVVVALALALWLRARGAEAPSYLTQPVTRGDLTEHVSATGSLAPTDEVAVGSELSGLVSAVLVDVDDRVSRGQVLARLDTTKLAAQAMQSRASLQSAEAQLQQRGVTLREARDQLARFEQVYRTSGGRVPSQQELDSQRAAVQRAEADVAGASAAVAQARAVVQANRTDLAKMVIRSPTNGVVLTRGVDPGQTVAASFQAPVLFTIAEDLTKMELTVNVDEADVGRVRREQEATFTVDAYPDRTFAARVAAVRYASQTVSGVVTYPTVLYVDNPDLLLRPGMTATADVVVQRVTNALLVPNAALRFTPAAPAAATRASGGTLLGRLMPRPPRMNRTQGAAAAQRVWVLRDGAPVAVPVETGGTNGSVTAVVRGRLAVGTPVIVDLAIGGKP